MHVHSFNMTRINESKGRRTGIGSITNPQIYSHAIRPRWNAIFLRHAVVSDGTNSTVMMTTSSKVGERAATARSHTSDAKIRLVVVVAYTVRKQYHGIYDADFK